MSSVTEMFNSFKVNQTIRIPFSNLMIIVDYNVGGYIFDMELLRIVKNFDILSDDVYAL